MWYNTAGTTFFRFVLDHAFDRQTDSFLVARLHYMQCMQRSKNYLLYL